MNMLDNARELKEFKDWCKRHGFKENNDTSLKLFLLANKEKAQKASGDTVVCLVCGKSYKRLKQHLRVVHSMSLLSYRKLFPEADTVAPNYSQAMRKMNEERGLQAFIDDTKIKKGEKRASKNGK